MQRGPPERGPHFKQLIVHAYAARLARVDEIPLLARTGSAWSATTMVITIRNSGYSQPPLALLNTQPLPMCTQAAPNNTGSNARATQRVRKLISNKIPPTVSARNTRYASGPGKPIDAKNCAVPASVNVKYFRIRP